MTASLLFRRSAFGILLPFFFVCATLPRLASAQPAAALDRAMALAEENLREGELRIAESHYREALKEGWMTLGAR